jgi:aminoglycoside phosphotransferase (APT) family kinase protein
MRTPVIDLDDDPATAAALLERAAPDLGAPTAVVQEPGAPHDVARWAVRTARGAWRMKVATDPAAKARLRRGVGVLAALAEHAAGPSAAGPLRVPRVERVWDPGAEAAGLPLVVVEARLGASDAASRWGRLSPAGRDALLEPLARALHVLHAVPASAVARTEPPSAARAEGPVPARGPVPWREAARAGVARRVARVRAQGSLPCDLLARVEERLLAGVAAIPDGVERRLCHGRVRPSSVALGADAFVGLRDFEEARAADPLTDAALWMLSTGDPAGKSSRRFLDAFARERPPVPDLATRVDAYLGLETLRVVSEAADADASDALDALSQALEQWLAGAWGILRGV